MAIGPGYKTFTFDGQNSGSYDVYITGEAVYNAPERTVEMITIPGRDGDFVLDKGRYENIPVKYPAGMYGDDQSAFAAKVRAFRNMMASRVGYCRLEDEYNPDEYRLAVYKSGLDVDPVPFQRAGEFEILFDCKPQRFLKSGEAAVAVANNGKLTNPTLHASKPLLEVEGYGTINLGSEKIKISNKTIGHTQLSEDVHDYTGVAGTMSLVSNISIPGDLLAAGDLITLEARTQAGMTFTRPFQGGQSAISVQSTTGIVSSVIGSANYKAYDGIGNPPGRFITKLGATGVSFSKGTAETKTGTVSILLHYASTYQPTLTITLTADYDGDSTITFTQTVSITDGAYTKTGFLDDTVSNIYGDSTIPALGNPMYIDLDIGEAWNEDHSEPVSVNDAVQLPAELPTLKPGETTITYSNTITSLKIIPRWWEV